ncbi:MAG: hypothetical protein ABI588_00930, partial [Arenimonas sp.]
MPVTVELDIADTELLDRFQRAAWAYFPANTCASTGLAFDNSRPGAPVSIAVVGFALASCPVAVQRGWIARDAAVTYCLAALRFLHDSDQSGSADATGFRGFYFHFLHRD